MVTGDTLLLLATVFGAVLMGVQGVCLWYADGRAGRRMTLRRLRLPGGGASRREAVAALRRKPRERPGLLARFDGGLAWLDRLVRQAGFAVPLSRLALAMGATAILVVAGAVTVANGTSPVGIVAIAGAAAGLGFGLPIVGLARLRARRFARFAAQLPEALDIMVRSLRAGHPITAAMTLVSREMADPIRAEFGIAVAEMTYGLDLRDALGSLAQRVDVADLHYLTVAINIQHETGGNLAEVLHGLATVIRARLRMVQKVRAVSAEGRLSARLLAVMPFGFAGLVYAARPEFYLAVAGDPIFLPVLAGAVALEAAGIYIMYRLVNFHV